MVSFTVNGSGTATGAASASENAAGTTATITATGLDLLGFYPGELVNVSGFTTQTGFNGTYAITATSGNTFSYADALTAQRHRHRRNGLSRRGGSELGIVAGEPSVHGG